jgi:chromosome segregation ATPase
MKVLPVLCSALTLIWAGSIGQGDESVGTTNGTYVLTDLQSLTSTSARQSADRIAQLALAGTAADVASDEKELNEIQEKINTHNAAIEQLNKDITDYKTALNAYNAKLVPHNNQVAAYSSEVADQQAQVAQSNNLPPQQRSQATVNRLNNWKARLDKRKAALNREKKELDAQKAILDPKSQSINSRAQTLDDEAKQLNPELDSIKTKLGEAYRQLQLSYNYSVQIKELLSKDGIATTAEDKEALASASDALQRLRFVSNAASNSSAEKTSLDSTEVQPATGGPSNE